MRSKSLFEPLKFLLRAAPVLLLPLLFGGWSAPGNQMLDGHQSTIFVDGEVADRQYHVFEVTLWVTGVIFVVVGAVLAYATVKFKARSSADEHAEPPPQGHGNPFVEIGLIVVSIAALVVIAVPTVREIWHTQRVPEEYKKDLMIVKATGYQWWFKFEYAGLTAKSPVGSTVNEVPLVVANELVIPVDTPIRIDLRSQDVIHSFWLPKIAGKVDMIPNRGNYLWLKASKPGYYWGQCAEYCGEEHGNMRFRAVVLSKQDWAEWVARQQQPARADQSTPNQAQAAIRLLAKNERTNLDGDMFSVWQGRQKAPASEDHALIAKGRELFQKKTCAGCHTIRGHEGAGITAPDLTHFGARTTLAAAIRDNTPENLKQWVHAPDDVKPGNKMWREGYNAKAQDPHADLQPMFRVDEQEAEALVAYLHSLR